MTELLQIPIFPVFLTLFAFCAGTALRKKTRSALFNPILVAAVIILAFMFVTGMELKVFQAGKVRVFTAAQIQFFQAHQTGQLGKSIHRLVYQCQPGKIRTVADGGKEKIGRQQQNKLAASAGIVHTTDRYRHCGAEDPETPDATD